MKNFADIADLAVLPDKCGSAQLCLFNLIFYIYVIDYFCCCLPCVCLVSGRTGMHWMVAHQLHRKYCNTLQLINNHFSLLCQLWCSLFLGGFLLSYTVSNAVKPMKKTVEIGLFFFFIHILMHVF